MEQLPRSGTGNVLGDVKLQAKLPGLKTLTTGFHLSSFFVSFFICGSLPVSRPLCSDGFNGLVCSRNLWIKVISRSSTFSQGFECSLLPLCRPQCVIVADMCYHRTHAQTPAESKGANTSVSLK